MDAMKTLRLLLVVFVSLLPVRALAEEEQAKPELPVVEVYEIRKDERGSPQGGNVVLKVWNPTDWTIYFPARELRSPLYDVEVKRGEKWVIVTGSFEPGAETEAEVYALRPGAAVLVTVSPTWDETARRFRFYFYTEEDEKKAKVYSVRSRAVGVEELGPRKGPVIPDEYRTLIEPREPFTDAEVNERQAKEMEGKK